MADKNEKAWQQLCYVVPVTGYEVITSNCRLGPRTAEPCFVRSKNIF